MQLDSVVRPSCLDIWFSSHPCPQVTVVLPAFQSRNVHGQAGTTNHSVQVDWATLACTCPFCGFFVVVFLLVCFLFFFSERPAMWWPGKFLNYCTLATDLGSWSPFPGPGESGAGRAWGGLTVELAVEAIGSMCNGTVYTCEDGTFILLNWNIILQCYICE